MKSDIRDGSHSFNSLLFSYQSLKINFWHSEASVSQHSIKLKKLPWLCTQCIASNWIFCTGGHDSLVMKTTRSHQKSSYSFSLGIGVVTKDPYDHLYKISNWKQCIVGRSQHSLWSKMAYSKASIRFSECNKYICILWTYCLHLCLSDWDH